MCVQILLVSAFAFRGDGADPTVGEKMTNAEEGFEIVLTDVHDGKYCHEGKVKDKGG